MKGIVKKKNAIFSSLVLSTKATGLLTTLALLCVVFSSTMLASITEAATGNYLWVANARSNTVSKVDTDTNSVAATINVGAFPYAVAVAKSHVFVANRDSKSISIINKATDLVESTLELDRHPLAVAMGADGCLYAIVTINTIAYTSSNMAYLYRIDLGTYSKIDEMSLRTVSSLHIGIGVNSDNIAYIPYNYSWSGNTGTMIVDLNTFTKKGTYTHSPTTYGYLGPGIAIDQDGNGWVSGMRVSGQQSIIKITPNGQRTFHGSIGNRGELVFDTSGSLWATNYPDPLIKFNISDASSQTYSEKSWATGYSMVRGLTFLNDYIWLIDTSTDSIRKINPADGSEVAVIPVGDSPYSIGDLSGIEALMAGLDVTPADVNPIELDTLSSGNFTTPEENHYLKINILAGGFIQVILDDLDDIGDNELYVQCGSLPTPYRYDFRSENPGSADQELIISTTEAETCYILIRGVEASGDYNFTTTPVDLGIFDVIPNYYGNTADAVVTMSGTGFDAQTTISLISNEGVEYHPELTEVDSLFQLTTFFNLSEVPVGRYDVKVANQTESLILENGFEVIETQKANLETHLILPAFFGRHAVATVYIEYENTGNVAMPAPMLILRSADEDDSDKPLLTLDSSRIMENFHTYTLPTGVGHTVQFLADGDGDSPGLLQPGESGRVPVYYIGLLRPWVFSDTSVELEIKIIKADEETPFDWDSRKAVMKPESMDDQAWDIIFANLVNAVGDTWGDYITALSENSVYLSRHCNQTVRDINELFQFELIQAMGASHPLPYLAGDTDIAIAAPGLPLVFSRSFSSSISDRFTKGTLGKGWSHSWQTSLEEDAEGNVVITSMNRGRTYQPDIRGGYFSPAGDYSTLSKSGDIFTLTFPNGIIQRFRADGKLDYLEDLNGNRITAEYSADLLSRLVHSAGQYLSFTYTSGRISTISDHTGELSVDFAYDLFGDQLASVTDILGRTTYYSYYQTGPSAYAMAGVAYPDNTEQSFSYDENGRLRETAFNAIPQSYFSYDSGTVTITTAADNSSYSFYYDAKGQLIKSVDPLDGITASAFDDNYNLLRVTGPDGLSTSMTHDRSGNITQVTDPLGQQVKMGYGSFNRMTSITDGEASTTGFSYDSQGNNDSTIYPDNSQESYAYDHLGNLAQRTNRRGAAVDYSYDNNGFVQQKTYGDGITASYSYDEVGMITSVTDPTGTTTLIYYANHLLKRITYPGNLFLEYSYDSLGRRTEVIDQSGYELHYTYNAFGQLESISQAGGDEIVHYSYDSRHRLSVKTMGNGISTTYDHDPAGRLIHLVNYAADNLILSRFDYEYDVRGRRTSMSTLDGNWEYSYDKIGQLTEAVFTSSHPEIGDRAISYTYDKAGNRTEERVDGSSINYTSNNLNQYSQAGSVTYAYDIDGNLTAKIAGGDTWQYSYNDDNKLVSVSGPEGVTEYQYDGLGNLTAVTENGTTRYYLIDPSGFGNVVGEYDETGALLTRYTYGMGLISKDDYFYTFDGNGNTSELTDGLSAEVNSYVYEPFGDVLYSSESVSNDFEYVGQFGIRQAGNDFLYMRNRFYMPSTGRFISEDPIGLAGGINLYAYVYNDPVNFIDPYGLSARDAIKGLYFGIKATGAVTMEVARIVAKDIAVATTGSYLKIPYVVDKAMTGMSIYGDVVGLGEVGTKVSDKINSIRDEMYNEQPYQRAIPEIHMPTDLSSTCL